MQQILDPFGMFSDSVPVKEVPVMCKKDELQDEICIKSDEQKEIPVFNEAENVQESPEPPQELNLHQLATEDMSKEVVKENTEEPEKENGSEPQKKEVAEPEEKEATATEEEKSQKTKKTKAKSTKSSKKEVELEDYEPVNLKTDISNVDIDKVVKKFFPFNNDEKWNAFRDEIDDEIDKIRLDSDINLGTLKILLPLVSNIYTRVRPYKGDLEAFHKTFENFISRQQALNAVGANPEARKKRGYESCENFSFGNLKGEDNLYDIEILFRHRYETVKSWLDILENKRSIMFNLLTLLTKKVNE